MTIRSNISRSRGRMRKRCGILAALGLVFASGIHSSQLTALDQSTSSLEGTWQLTYAETGAVAGALEIRAGSGRQITVKGEFLDGRPGRLPPALTGTGELTNAGGQYHWHAFDGREGRATIDVKPDGLLIDVRCTLGTCAGSRWTLRGTRAPAGSAPATAREVVPRPGASAVAAPTTRSPREWREVRSVEGGFRVEFPGEPASRKRSMRIEKGAVNVTTFGLSLDDGWTSMLVAFGDYPAHLIESRTSEQLVQQLSRDHLAAAESTCRVLAERAISLTGHPGIEGTCESAGGIQLRFRRVLSGRRMYVQLGGTNPQDSRSDPSAIDRFFNSFALITR